MVVLGRSHIFAAQASHGPAHAYRFASARAHAHLARGGRVSACGPFLFAARVGLRRNKPSLLFCNADSATTESEVTAPVEDDNQPQNTSPKIPYSDLQVGEKYSGVVKGVAGFGAFVDFGAASDCLVHISELKRAFVENPKDVVSVGDEVEFKLLAFDAERKRISGSMKQVEIENAGGDEYTGEGDQEGEYTKVDPRQRKERKTQRRPRGNEKVSYKPGDEVSGTVDAVLAWGAFVTLPKGRGLLHISELSAVKDNNSNELANAADYISEGDDLTLRVLSIDKGKISLTQKSAEEIQKDIELAQSGMSAGPEEPAESMFTLLFKDAGIKPAMFDAMPEGASLSYDEEDTLGDTVAKSTPQMVPVPSTVGETATSETDAPAAETVEAAPKPETQAEVVEPEPEPKTQAEVEEADVETTAAEAVEPEPEPETQAEVVKPEPELETQAEVEDADVDTAAAAAAAAEVVEAEAEPETQVPQEEEETKSEEEVQQTVESDVADKETDVKAEADVETDAVDAEVIESEPEMEPVAEVETPVEEVTQQEEEDQALEAEPADPVAEMEVSQEEVVESVSEAQPTVDTETQTEEEIVDEEPSKPKEYDDSLDVVMLYTQAAFNEFKVKGGDIVCIDVSIPDCEPCARIFPAVEALARNFKGCVNFGRFIFDQDPDREAVIVEYGIKEVPTFLFFREGQEIDRLVSSRQGDLAGHILRVVGALGIVPPPPPSKRVAEPIEEKEAIPEPAPLAEAIQSVSKGESSPATGIDAGAPAITAKLVKQLRDKTGVGMMDCKKALADNNGDLEAAEADLKKKGKLTAAKKAGRIAAEGVIGSYIHTGSRLGVMVEVNCETDFVARGDLFKQLVEDMSMQIAASPDVTCVAVDDFPADVLEKEKKIELAKEDLQSKPPEIRERMVMGRLEKLKKTAALLEQPFVKDQDKTVQDIITDAVSTLGENISIRRFERFNLGEGLEKRSDDFASEVSEQTQIKKSKDDAPKKEEAPKAEVAEPAAPAVQISAKDVKSLRMKTGAGMMDCKKALQECEGNLEAAEEYLKVKGIAGADKKAGRIAAEGSVASYIHTGARLGILIEVNCETDFVAKNEVFKDLVEDMAMQVAACPEVQFVKSSDISQEVLDKEREVEMAKEDLQSKPEQVREMMVKGRLEKYAKTLSLMDQDYVKDPSKTVEQVVKEVIATLGENIQVRRFTRFNLGEGLEKRTDDFAAEVAAQTGGV